jgi:hypothetical protein
MAALLDACEAAFDDLGFGSIQSFVPEGSELQTLEF